MKRVFIAGATGTLGRHLCAEYQRRGWYVIALVRNATQAAPLAADQLVEARARDPLTLKGVMAGADLVVSCLGMTRQTDGPGYREVDYQANLNLLREAERAGVGEFGYLQTTDANEPSHVPVDAAKTAFLAALRRSAIAATVITPGDGSGHAHFVPGAVALDMAGAGHVTRDTTDHPENNLATTRTAIIHSIAIERKNS